MSGNLSQWLRGDVRPRVLVVGDVMLDRHVEGRVERVSPEAPIPILDAVSRSERIGGAGFTAQAAAVLGAETALVGLVGQDDAGERVRRAAEAAGVRWAGAIATDRPTCVKTRLLARNHNTAAQQLLRVDEEERRPLGAALETAVMDALAREVPRAAIVLVNDYGKGLLSPPVLAAIHALAREHGVRVVVDPHKGAHIDGYRGATAYTPNRPEAELASGRRIAHADDAAAAAAILLERLDLECVLVTLDREGMLLLQRGGRPLHLPTTPREVFDVTGAGDIVLATFGYALALGAPADEAAQLANVAAGLEVERVGVVPIAPDEIRARLALSVGGSLAKCLPRAEAGALGARLREQGRRIVFTNGCFDILHAGHVRYLARAKAEGDVLVVGVNDDDSVRGLKGPERPLVPLGDRLEVLAGLAAVDFLFAFAEADPGRLIDELQPDVLVKGADWRERGALGAASVEARGGRVVFVELLEGRSTTGLVARIQGR